MSPAFKSCIHVFIRKRWNISILLGFPGQVELAGPVPEGSGHILAPWRQRHGSVPSRARTIWAKAWENHGKALKKKHQILMFNDRVHMSQLKFLFTNYKLAVKAWNPKNCFNRKDGSKLPLCLVSLIPKRHLASNYLRSPAKNLVVCISKIGTYKMVRSDVCCFITSRK